MNSQKSSARKKRINSLSTAHTITPSSYNLEPSPHGTLESTPCPPTNSRSSANTSMTISGKDSSAPLSLRPLHQSSSSRKWMENYASASTIEASTRSQSRTATPCRSSMNYSTASATPGTSRNVTCATGTIDYVWPPAKNGKQPSALAMASTNTWSCLLVSAMPPVPSNTTLTTSSTTTWMTSWQAISTTSSSSLRHSRNTRYTYARSYSALKNTSCIRNPANVNSPRHESRS